MKFSILNVLYSQSPGSPRHLKTIGLFATREEANMMKENLLKDKKFVDKFLVWTISHYHKDLLFEIVECELGSCLENLY